MRADTAGAARPRPRLHFVAKHEEFGANLQATAIPGQFESGVWVVAHDTAERAKVAGAEIHLHAGRDQESWKSGIIIDWRPSPAEPRRVIFTFVVDDGLRRQQLGGWGQEKAYVGLKDNSLD